MGKGRPVLVNRTIGKGLVFFNPREGVAGVYVIPLLFRSPTPPKKKKQQINHNKTLP